MSPDPKYILIKYLSLRALGPVIIITSHMVPKYSVAEMCQGRAPGFPQITIIALAKQLPEGAPAGALAHHNKAPLPADTQAQRLALTGSLKNALSSVLSQPYCSELRE